MDMYMYMYVCTCTNDEITFSVCGRAGARKKGRNEKMRK
jgi:hypothetical protein